MNRTRILYIGYALAISLAVGAATAIFNNMHYGQVMHHVMKEQEERITTFWSLLHDKGGDDFRIVDGRMMVGNYVLNNNFEVPDRIRTIFGGTATIFMHDVRISTNVPLADGRRAVGTHLTGPAFEAVLHNGQPFRGEVPILGTPYFTAYDPIRDKNGTVIGVLYVGIPKKEILANFNEFRNRMIEIAAILDLIFIVAGICLIKRYRAKEKTLQASEHRYRTLFEGSTDAILLMGDKILDGNRAAIELLGLSREELTGPTPAFLTPLLGDAATLKEEPRLLSWRFRRPDGGDVFTETSLTPLDLEGQRLSLAVLRDVTQRVRMEETLQLNRFAIDNASGFMFILDGNGCIVTVNKTACSFIGRSAEELAGQELGTALSLETTDWAIAWQRLTGEGSIQMETVAGNDSGEILPLEITGSRLKYADTEYFFIFGKNISLRRQAEKRMGEIAGILMEANGEAFFSILAQDLTRLLKVDYVIISELVPDQPGMARTVAAFGRGEEMPPFSYALSGTPCDEATISDSYFVPEGILDLYPDIPLLREMGAEAYAAVPLRAADESVIGILSVFHCAPIRDREIIDSAFRIFAERAAGELQRRRAEQRLTSMAGLLQLVTDSVPASLAYVDADLTYRFVNRRYTELYALPAMVTGEPFSRFVPEEDHPTTWSMVRQALHGIPVTWENNFARGNGDFISLLSSYIPHTDQQGDVIGFFVQHVDITELKRLEQEREAQISRMRRQQQLLLSLSTHKTEVSEEGPLPAIRQISESAAMALNTSRVGIWLLSPDGTSLTCADLYEREFGRHSSGQSLQAANFPAYFRSLESEKIVNAPNALTDIRTTAFADGYLHPHGIVSMLDAAISTEGKVVGVVCMEETGTSRTWQPDEVSFAMAIADQVTAVLLAEERNRRDYALRQSEERYRTVFDTSGTAMVILNADGTIGLTNKEFLRLSGYCREELEKEPTSLLAMVLPEQREQLLVHLGKGSASMDAQNLYEITLVNRTGDKSQCLCQISRLPGTSQSVASLLDITPLREMAATLSRQLSFLQTLINTIPNPIFFKDREGRYIGCNHAFEEYLGRSLSDISGKGVHDIFPPNLAAIYADKDEDLFNNPGIQVYESKVRAANGVTRNVVFNKATFTGDGGEVGGLVGVILDITVQKQTELLLDAERRVIEFSDRDLPLPELLEFLCLSIEELIPEALCSVLLTDATGRTLVHAAAPSLPPEFTSRVSGTRIGPGIGACGTAAYSHSRVISDDIATDSNWQRYRDLPLSHGLAACWSEPILSSGGDVLGTFALYFTSPRRPQQMELPIMERAARLARIIIEKRRSEEAFRESEERFHQLYAQNDDAIVLCSLDTLRIIDMNPAAHALLGCQEPLTDHCTMDNLLLPEEFSRFLHAIPMDDNSGSFQFDRITARCANGISIEVSMRCKVLRLRQEYTLFCSLRDIREKLRFEEEARTTHAKLIQTNKMTSLGLLASSIAHEINNPNNYISVNTSMLEGIYNDLLPLLRRQEDEEGHLAIGKLPFSEIEAMVPRLFIGIKEGSRRINSIISNMRDLVKTDRIGTDGTIDLNAIIQDACTILNNHIMKYTNNFNLSLAEPLPQARGNRQQIEQVIINLISNALQALPTNGAGVTVSTSTADSGNEIIIRVRDEGKGISAEHLQHLTEPFFSTRLDEGGTGLGLYISSSIIKEHGGTLSFESIPGQGTTVTVTLPKAALPPA